MVSELTAGVSIKTNATEGPVVEEKIEAVAEVPSDVGGGVGEEEQEEEQREADLLEKCSSRFARNKSSKKSKEKSYKEKRMLEKFSSRFARTGFRVA